MDAPPFDYLEVQLTVPVEDFLIQCWDWSDLRSNLNSLLRRTMVQSHQPDQSAFASASSQYRSVIMSN
jgi:hypothetical protein